MLQATLLLAHYAIVASSKPIGPEGRGVDRDQWIDNEPMSRGLGERGPAASLASSPRAIQVITHFLPGGRRVVQTRNININVLSNLPFADIVRSFRGPIEGPA